MNHKHGCHCEHESVAYCKHCGVVFCRGCNQEWGKKYFGYQWNWQPYYLGGYAGNTYTTGLHSSSLGQNTDNSDALFNAQQTLAGHKHE